MYGWFAYHELVIGKLACSFDEVNLFKPDKTMELKQTELV